MMRYLQRFWGQLKNELLEEQVPDSSRVAPNPYLARALVLQDIMYHQSADWQACIRIRTRGYGITENQVKSAIADLSNKRLIEHIELEGSSLVHYKTTELGSRIANSESSPEPLAEMWAALDELVSSKQSI